MASLEVAFIWICKNQWKNKFFLADEEVTGITAFLTTPGRTIGNPYQLKNSCDRCFKGSDIYGMRFTLKPDEAEALISKDQRHTDILFPFLNGDDLNSNPRQSASRWIINFRDWSLDLEHDDPKQPKGSPYASDYPDCLKILIEKVKPERDKLLSGGSSARDQAKRWWQFSRPIVNLYDVISNLDQVLAISTHTKYAAFAFVSTKQVFSHALAIVSSDEFGVLGILCSSVYESWAFEYGSSLGHTLRYTPSDCFETFPFPTPDPSNLSTQFPTLNTIGETYYTHRQAIMRERQEGLTKTYNRFHDANETASDIQKLRDLHVEMDQAVAAAYGWQDLDLGHGFHQTKQGIRFTISETARREVLDRLLELNHQRYAEEVAQGLHDKKGKKKTKVTPKKSKSKVDSGQGSLL